MATSRAQGRTARYDALLLSLDHLDAGKRDKKTLILVSDGGDNASAHTFKDLMLAVRTSQATIYSIGIFDESDPDRNPELLGNIVPGAFPPVLAIVLRSLQHGLLWSVHTRDNVNIIPKARALVSVGRRRTTVTFAGCE